MRLQFAIRELVDTVGASNCLCDAFKGRMHLIRLRSSILRHVDTARSFLSPQVHTAFSEIPSQEREPVVHGDLCRWPGLLNIATVQIPVLRQCEHFTLFAFPLTCEVITVVFAENILR